MDLYGGRVTTDSAVAQKLRAEVYGDPAGTIAILTTWIDRLRKDRRTTGKIGLIGSSMGRRLGNAGGHRWPG